MSSDVAKAIASLSDNARHTIEVMIDGVLVPHVLRHRRVPAFFRRLRRFHLLRAAVDDRHVPELLTRLDLRDERSYQRTLTWLEPVILPALYDEAIEGVRLAAGQDGPPLTHQQIHLQLLSAGWKLSNQAAYRVVRDLELREVLRPAGARGYVLPTGGAALSASELTTGRLAAFLGGLTRTLLQRFERVTGSAFEIRELFLLPRDVPVFLAVLEQRLAAQLDLLAVPAKEIAPEQREAHAVVQVGVLAGPAGRPGLLEVETAPWTELFGCVVGGDVGNRIGSVDVAEGVLQRHILDRLMEEAEAAGENGFARARERHGIRSANTVRQWRGQESLDDRAGLRPQELEVTAALLEGMIAESWPKPITRERLLEGLRERGGVVDPVGVHLALSGLAARGRIIPGVNGWGEPHYRLAQPDVLTTFEELDKMKGVLKEDLVPLSGIAEAAQSEAPGTGVFILRRVLPRKHLETLRPELVRILDEVFKNFLSLYGQETEWSAFSARGGLKVVVCLESHVKPLLF